MRTIQHDALQQLSEMAVSTKRLAITAIDDVKDNETAEILVAISAMCSLMGVICTRYGADTHTIDEHILAPLHLDNLREAELHATTEHTS